MINNLKAYGAAILLIGLIFFIGNRAIHTANHKRKALYIGIFGLVIIVFFGLGYFIEKYAYLDLISANQDLIFLIVTVVITVSFVTYDIIKGFSRREQFASFQKPKEKQIPTIKNKQQYLYFVFRYQDSFILREIEEKNQPIHYTGYVIKFPKGEFFHDEFSSKILEEMHIDSKYAKKIGTATIHENKDQVYYCYVVDLENEFQDMTGFKTIKMQDLIHYSMNSFDKSILYRVILREDFDIEMEKEEK